MEKDELPKKALLREFFEETGIKLNPSKVLFFKTGYIRDPKNDFIFHMFTYEFSQKSFVRLNQKEHQAMHWETFKNAIQLLLLMGKIECFWLLKHSKN